jgi:CHAT domain-containing protein
VKLNIILIAFYVFYFGIVRAQNFLDLKKKYVSFCTSNNNDSIIYYGNWILKNYSITNAEREGLNYQIGYSYYLSNDYISSTSYLKKAKISIEKNKSGKEGFYSRTLNLIANNYSELKQYDSSLTYNKLANEAYKVSHGKQHQFYAITLASTAQTLSNLRDFDQSDKFFKEAIGIFELNGQQRTIQYAELIMSAGGNLYYSEKYNEALTNQLQAKRLFEKENNIYSEEYLICLNYLSSIYTSLKQYSEAKEINQYSLFIQEKYFSKESINYTNTLSNLSINYSDLGDLDSAAYCLKMCLELTGKVLGQESEAYLISLNNLGELYFRQGNYLEALRTHEKCLDKKLKSSSISTLNLAVTYNNLGKSAKYNNENKRARQYYLKALEIQIKDNGDLSNLFKTYTNLGFVNIELENYTEAQFDFEESLRLQLDRFYKLKTGLSTKILNDIKNELDVTFYALNNLCFVNYNVKNSTFNNWVSLKAIIGADFRLAMKEAASENNLSLFLVFKKITQIKNEINNLNQQDIGVDNSKVSRIKELNKELELQEMELSRNTEIFKLLNRTFNFQDVYSKLNKNEVFIDIIKYPKFSFNSNQWTDSLQYLVFMFDSRDTLVDYVFIEDGTQIDQDLFDQYQQEATDPERKTDLTSEKFYNYFWKPIADKIGDAKTIYISLGGVYNNINLNTIYNPETGKYLLEEKDIRIVNSAREFILNKERETKTYTNNTASLFGFPNFDGNTTVTADASDLFASTRDLSSFWLDSLTRGGLKAKPLPATKTEVENISSSLKSKGWQVTSYLADNASETNIKTQQSPRVLHVATHGYFFPDIPMEDKDQTRFLGMDRQQVVQDPMLRSGLLLTGANRTLKGESSTGENGLLSAAEASLLDLRETELVVLSACETGKGEVKNSEGVYGLRKAFSNAGAQNIIMSLWKVDDKVTQEFMSRFYEIWLNDKTSIREAFNRTQLEIKAKYPQPYYWGAFILVGESFN